MVLCLAAPLILGPRVAYAQSEDENYGWVYRSSDSDCTYFWDYMNWDHVSVSTTADLAYNYFYGTDPCSTQWNCQRGSLR
jgi:hypothetical protein